MLDQQAIETMRPFDGPIPGQSLTNSPESQQAYEGAPEFTNVRAATSAIFARLFTLSISSRAQNEQFNPMANGLACFIEIQNASIVCPERFLPERSVAVHDRMRGSVT